MKGRWLLAVVALWLLAEFADCASSIANLQAAELQSQTKAVAAQAQIPSLAVPLAPSPASVFQTTDENDVAALRIFQQGSRNFNQLQSQGLKGWLDPTGNATTDPCSGSWTGVTCDGAARRITGLELVNLGIETRLPPELALLTELEVLNLTGNNLVGGIPSNWGQDSTFASLQTLDLSNNPNLSGAIPPVWGTQGSFISLKALRLDRTGASGQLPQAWGSQQSLPNMTYLNLSSNYLDGMLPPAWGTVGAFGSLLHLDLSNNSFSGSLPLQWGDAEAGDIFPALQSLKLSYNSFFGFMPQSWGTAFHNMTTLELRNNSLTGSLPSTWAAAGQWQKLTALDLRYNNFSGTFPSSWGNWSRLTDLSLQLFPGSQDVCQQLSPSLRLILSTASTQQTAANMMICQVSHTPAPAPSSVPASAESPAPAPEPAESQSESLVPAPDLIVMPLLVPAESPAAAPVQVPSPSGVDLAQITARYNLTGNNLLPLTDPTRQTLESALSNTLGTSSVALQSLVPSSSSRRRLLQISQTAEGVFLINSTFTRAPLIVDTMNNTNTSNAFREQLYQQGLTTVQPTFGGATFGPPAVTASGPAPGQLPTTVVPVPAPKSSSGISGGAIGGIVAGVAVAMLLAAGMFAYCRQRNGKRAKISKHAEDEADKDVKSGGKEESSGLSLQGKDPDSVSVFFSGEKDIESGHSTQSPARPSWPYWKRLGRKPEQAGLQQRHDEARAASEQRHKDDPGSTPRQGSTRPQPGIGSDSELDSFEAEEGEALQKITLPVSSDASTSQQTSPEISSPPSPLESTSDHTAMISEIVPDVTEIFADKDGKVAPRSKNRTVKFDIDDTEPPYRHKHASSTGRVQAQRQGSGGIKDASKLGALPSSYSRRHTGGESAVRRDEQDAGVKQPTYHGHEIIGGHGYRKRAPDKEERAPPPSFHRRASDLAGKAEPLRRGSGNISRAGSGTVPSRQSSTSLPRAHSGTGMDSLARLVAGLPRTNSGGLHSGRLSRSASRDDVPELSRKRSASNADLIGRQDSRSLDEPADRGTPRETRRMTPERSNRAQSMTYLSGYAPGGFKGSSNTGLDRARLRQPSPGDTRPQSRRQSSWAEANIVPEEPPKADLRRPVAPPRAREHHDFASKRQEVAGSQYASMAAEGRARYRSCLDKLAQLERRLREEEREGKSNSKSSDYREFVATARQTIRGTDTETEEGVEVVRKIEKWLNHFIRNKERS